MSTITGCILGCLDQFAIFRDMPQDQLSKLSTFLHKKTFSAGTMLMALEQMGETVYFILDGTVKVFVEQEDGTEVIITVLGGGDVVGEMSSLDDAGRCANVATMEESTLLWMDRSMFRECLRTMPEMAMNLSQLLARRLRQANEQVQALATQDIECRIARQILAFADRYGEPLPNGDTLIPVRLTQTDIASLVGATRERANKILVSYKERGYLSVSRDHHLTIHNRRALANRCQ